METTTKHVYVIGDIGGHVEELYMGLVVAGADPQTLRLPGNTVVVQLGDLVDTGPQSFETLELAAAVARKNPTQYVQLVGNHELNYKNDLQFYPKNGTAMSDVKAFLENVPNYLAASVTTDGGEYLITHAGLTSDLWRLLGSPTSATKAAQLINSAFEKDTPLLKNLLAPGRMLGSNEKPGVTWAEAGFELYTSWREVPIPFSQVHGHTSARWWSTKDKWVAPTWVKSRCHLDSDTRHLHFTTTKSNAQIIGVDPCFGEYAGVRWRPLHLFGAMTEPQ